MAEDDKPDPNDPTVLAAPFIFVRHGDPEPTEWLREHPGAVRIPATFVPRPVDQAEQAARMRLPSTTPGSLAPLRRAGFWPVDRQGRPWPKDRFGNPMMPLNEYPPGVRSPGEPVSPEEQAVRDFDARTFDPIGEAVRMMRVMDDPARLAGIAAVPRATQPEITTVASDDSPGPNQYVPYDQLPLVSRQILRERRLLPNGQVAVTIPPGYIAEPATNGRGLVFREPGTTGDANTIRLMLPNEHNPTMYLRYYNSVGQPISPFTGRTGTDAETHFPFGGADVTPESP